MNLIYFFDLLFVLTKKEIKSRYKHAILGFLWIFINPLVQMIVMGFVFYQVLKFNIKFNIQNYYPFLFSGLLLWNFFSLSLNKATSSIVFERSLIQKSKFPREVIPISIILSNFVNFIISFLLLFIFLIINQNFSFLVPLNSIKFLLGCLNLLLLTIGISLFTSALTVFFRDIKFFIEAILLVWFYITPIIYPFSSIPQQYRIFFYLNPLTHIVSLFQNSILGQPLIYPGLIVAQSLFIYLFLGLAFIFFRNRSPYFSDWL